MSQESISLNQFLVEVFNEILKTEESCILKTGFSNLSLKELHVIEAVCSAEKKGTSCRASDIAAQLRVTAGTLTTSVSQLEKKGYLLRKKDKQDKRVVHVCSTELGRSADLRHAQFHQEMVEDVLATLTEQEVAVFIKALESVSTFFQAKYQSEESKSAPISSS